FGAAAVRTSSSITPAAPPAMYARPSRTATPSASPPTGAGDSTVGFIGLSSPTVTSPALVAAYSTNPASARSLTCEPTVTEPTRVNIVASVAEIDSTSILPSVVPTYSRSPARIRSLAVLPASATVRTSCGAAGGGLFTLITLTPAVPTAA